MTSVGHRLHTSDGHRTIFGNLNRTISTAAGHRTMCEKSKELSKISIQIGRCPSGQKSVGARTIIKFAGDLRIAEIVRCQCFCDHSIICVPIFTMQTSIVVAQWLKGRPVCLRVTPPSLLVRSIQGDLDGTQYATGRYAVRRNSVISYADINFYIKKVQFSSKTLHT